MRIDTLAQRVIWSASDLKAAAECEFAWARAIDAKLGRVPAVEEPEDATLKRAAELGEELLGAAHSACYSMAFAHALAGNGTAPESLQVTAAVTFVPGEGITGSHLLVSAKIPGLSEEDFQRIAEDAKQNCPVSQALAGIPITLEASLA